MPTYDYRCNACRHEFEEFQSIKAPALRTCPRCKKKTLERLIGTGGAILFKGSGFYQTDYRSESYTKAAKQDAKHDAGESSAKPADASAAKADATATPAAKPEPAASEPVKVKPAKSSSAKRRAGSKR